MNCSKCECELTEPGWQLGEQTLCQECWEGFTADVWWDRLLYPWKCEDYADTPTDPTP